MGRGRRSRLALVAEDAAAHAGSDTGVGQAFLPVLARYKVSFIEENLVFVSLTGIDGLGR
jgi:hypothetical protein